ncbi:hypothetical protein GF312_19990, partial [Candidatus Poribacteria bacterium]|nr:hypothetical protein [Candidatus Poribacteria bacterium]
MNRGLFCFIFTIIFMFTGYLTAQVSEDIQNESAVLMENIPDEKAEIEETEPEPKEELEIEKIKKMEAEMAKPEPVDYYINPGDIIDIRVAEHPEYDFAVLVQPDGGISYPPLGKLYVTGITEKQLAGIITKGLSSYTVNPKVNIAAIYETGDLKTDEYILKTGDLVYIEVKKHNNYNRTNVVQPNGNIDYSPLGKIKASGQNLSQLNQSITEGLSQYIMNPEIILEVRGSNKIIPKKDQIWGKTTKTPDRFGFDFFTGARNRILKIEDKVKDGKDIDITSPTVKDAISGFVGPIDMMDSNVSANIPSKYILSPGDRLTLHFWSDMEVDIQSIPLMVDSKGEVIIPKIGNISARGMTLAQFEEAARSLLSRVMYKNLGLVVTLETLKSIQIFISGEAFRPGRYAVSNVTSLFNALYMCGGPNDNGSLRDIKLLRNGETMAVDFYKYLMHGDSSQDFSLYAGDTIFIPRVGKTAMISGEVKRPAVYELKDDEKLLDLIELAGGIRPSGLLQRVQIDSVDP